MEKAKYPYFFIFGPEAEIWAICSSDDRSNLAPELQKKKWPYLASWATNRKTKDTFFSSTFEVGESKVSLLFLFVAQKPRYGQFLPLTIDQTLRPSFKRRNGHISAPGPQIEKLRTLSFLQLLKFDKAKYPYIFNLWPRG